MLAAGRRRRARCPVSSRLCRPLRRIRAWIPPLANRDEVASAPDVEARGFQLYRLPFSFHLRSLDEHPWGLKVTFPVSFSSLRINGVSDLGGFARNWHRGHHSRPRARDPRGQPCTLVRRSAKSESGKAVILAEGVLRRGAGAHTKSPT